MLAGFDGCAVAVAFEQPGVVVGVGELADAGAQLLVGVEAFDPEDLLFERADERFDAAVDSPMSRDVRLLGDSRPS